MFGIASLGVERFVIVSMVGTGCQRLGNWTVVVILSEKFDRDGCSVLTV